MKDHSRESTFKLEDQRNGRELKSNAIPTESTPQVIQPFRNSPRHNPAPSTSSLSPIFNLPNLPVAAQSASSLMDAVFGEKNVPLPQTTQTQSHPIRAEPFPLPPPRPAIAFKRKSKRNASGTSSSQSQTETESWETMSDTGSGSKLDHEEGVEVESKDKVGQMQERDEVVEELQKKVDRRRSQLPQLESELALLEAQIKAAEERLARVQVAQGTGGQVAG